MPGPIAVKAVLFDLYETLVTHFDPNWAPPPRSIAERLGLEETVYGEHWPPLDKAWQAGEIEHYEEALTRVCKVVGREPDASALAELTHEYRTMTARVFGTLGRQRPSALFRRFRRFVPSGPIEARPEDLRARVPQARC